jgi:7-cyano-7-deazaguanine synthase
MKEKAVVLLSGGLNSAVNVALALRQYEVITLSMHYRQCYARELRAAQLLVDHYSIEEHFICSLDMNLWTGSISTDFYHLPSVEAVPIDEQLRFSVPNRNIILLSVALSLAEAKNAKRIYIGINRRDDLSRDRYHLQTAQKILEKMLEFSSIASPPVQNRPLIEAPLDCYTKSEIIKLAIRLDVPIELTWSCSQCVSAPCGVCSSCRRRNEALTSVGLSHLVTP